MLKTRVISAVVLLPVILSLFAVGGWPYRLGIVAATLLAGSEYVRMIRLLGYPLQMPILSVVILGFGFSPIRDVIGAVDGAALPWTALSVLAASVWVLIQTRRRADLQGATELWALLLAGGMYLGLGGGYLIALRWLPSGLWWLLTVCGAVWLGDSAAYLIGTRWGRHKMMPSISPAKSWEGYSAQVLGGLLGGLFFAWLGARLSGGSSALRLWHGLLVGGIVSALSPGGDFLISLMKRQAGVKDTGRIIPGHGGILDRVDSLLWAGILGYMLAQLLMQG